MPEISIQSPGPDTSRFRYIIEIDGTPISAYLTYELYPEVPDQRDVLLVTQPIVLENNRQRQEYQVLQDTLAEAGTSRLGSTKSIVNQIAEGRITLENCVLTVHRFGAVPAYVTNCEQKITIGGSQIPVKIALYPLKRVGGRARKAVFRYVTNEDAFIQSLNIRLDRQLIRYLEDISEDFFDIMKHLSVEQAIRRTVAIRRTLSESVEEKLKRALPSEASAKRPQHERDLARKKLFDDFLQPVIVSAYAHDFASWFVYKFLGTLGVCSRRLAEKSKNRAEIPFGIFVPAVEKLLPDNAFDYIVDDVPEIVALRNAMSAYIQDRPSRPQNTSTWTDTFIEFAEFTRQLQEYTQSPGKPRIYIGTCSRDHLDNGTGRVCSYIRTVGTGAEVDVQREEIDLTDRIIDPPTRLWCPDSIVAILSSEDDHNLTWARVKELELAIQRRQLALAIARVDSRHESVLASVGEGAFFAANSRLSQAERVSRLRQRLPELFYPLLSEDTEEISLRLKEVLKYLVEESRHARHVRLVSGGMVALSEGDVARRDIGVISDIDRLFPYPSYSTKDVMARTLAKEEPRRYASEKSARRVIDQAFRRAGRITFKTTVGEELPLLRVNTDWPGKHRFCSGLDLVLRKLRPEWTKVKRKEWRRKVLSSLTV